MNAPYWSLGTLALYLLLANLGMFFLGKIARQSYSGLRRTSLNKYSIALMIIWLVIAVYRGVGYGIGGADTLEYLDFFKFCNSNFAGDELMEHTASDPLFLFINRACKYISNDYHLYFAVIYFIMIASIISFIKHFSVTKYCIVPYIMAFYLLLRGFASIRSNLAISFLLFGLVFLLKRKYFWAYLFAILVCLTHKGLALSVLSIPFCHYYLNRKFNIKYAILAVFIVYFLGLKIRQYFILFTMSTDLKGAYGAYASGAIDAGLSWVTIFGQIMLALFIVIFFKGIKFEIYKTSLSLPDERLKILLLVCIYDLLTVPINELLGNWRGYEFFYIPRLCMWCVIMYIITKKVGNRMLVEITFYFVFVAWFINRLYSTYDDSWLMPYVFGPLQ